MFRQKQVGNLIAGSVSDVQANSSLLLGEIIYISEKDRWYRVVDSNVSPNGETVVQTGVQGLVAICRDESVQSEQRVRRIGPGFVIECNLTALSEQYSGA